MITSPAEKALEELRLPKIDWVKILSVLFKTGKDSLQTEKWHKNYLTIVQFGNSSRLVSFKQNTHLLLTKR